MCLLVLPVCISMAIGGNMSFTSLYWWKHVSSTISIGGTACTVNKLRSLNLHFSSMFCIESKVVHVGAEKNSTLYLYKVSVKFKILALLLMMREN